MPKQNKTIFFLQNYKFNKTCSKQPVLKCSGWKFDEACMVCCKNVKHLQGEPLWWHNYWRDCGHPYNWNVAEMHRITRTQ